MNAITERLEYLRQELRNNTISYGEIAELESLTEHIDPSDVELLQAAGVPEFEEHPPMTEQPIIYWQDDATRLVPSTDPAYCCTIRQAHYAGAAIIETARVDLTTAQARELGHALITRAIMATPVNELDQHPDDIALITAQEDDCPPDEIWDGANCLIDPELYFPASTPQEDGRR
jgi:hypothetical protein